MDVRSQVSMVFHLDKCIGCHTCSIACKNIWTDRKGHRLHVVEQRRDETRHGVSHAQWEDQEKFKRRLGDQGRRDSSLKSTGKGADHSQHLPQSRTMPSMDDYYEPWTYDFQNLFNAPEGPMTNPPRKPISMVDRQITIDIEVGAELGRRSFERSRHSTPCQRPEPGWASRKNRNSNSWPIEQLVFFYFPRICNHCMNPGLRRVVSFRERSTNAARTASY